MRQIPVNDDVAAVSAVVVNYNAGELLVDSVRAALAQARQVVVVDNASADHSLQLLESCFDGEPRLQVLRNLDNLGFAAACNQGMALCREDHILFLNPDCVLVAGTLQQMLATLEADPEAGMVGGLLLNTDGTEQGGGRRAVPTPWRSFVRAVGLNRLAHRWPSLFFDFHLHKQPLPEHPVAVEAISGALMLVRRAAVDEVGLWDESYFLHCEDLDWCMRFRRQGWRILFDPAAPALHEHGACSQSRPVFVEWHKHKGMVRFYRKFFRHQYPGALMWLVIAGVWLRFALVAGLKACRNSVRGAAVTKILREQTATLQVAARARQHDAKRRTVAVVGASSMVGQALLPLLAGDGARVVAFSRRAEALRRQDSDVEWREMSTLFDDAAEIEPICDWVWLAPIRALPEHLAAMQRAGARHIVALSTTSRYTKLDSSSAAERQFVAELIAAEGQLQAWAEQNEAAWTILRPTLIYGMGLDKNVRVIARFIRRFRFFPVLGRASGLRQPIHARDVAAACKGALESAGAANHAYNISGAERLSYRDMVARIFEALALRPRFLSIPLWMFAAAVAVLRVLPPFRSWSAAMAERMNRDMVFGHEEAARDFGFAPQPFRPGAEDLGLVAKRGY